MNLAAGTRATMIPDIQGSIIGTLDSGTGALAKSGYQSFGENPAVLTGTYRYTARRFDPETAGSTSQPSGLYYYRARTYSPTWGRFLQPDPLGYPAGNNLYAYVGNDPLNRTDPTGNDFVVGPTVGAIAGAYYGALGALTTGGGATGAVIGGLAGAVAGAASGFFDPTLGIRTLAVVGGVSGAVGDVLGQVIANESNGRPAFSGINFGSTIGAGLAGVIGGGYGSLVAETTAAAGFSPLAATIGAALITAPPQVLLPGAGAAIANFYQGLAAGK